MLIHLNKKLNDLKARMQKSPENKSRQGQAGLVLIFFLVVGLILYAITLNWTRVAALKTMTIKAVDISAAAMASYVASYGEKQFVETLDRENPKCAYSGFLAALIMWGPILLALALLDPFLGLGAYAFFGTTGVMAVFSLPLYVAYEQEQQLTQMWNEMVAKAMGPKDESLERGIQYALQEVVSDSVRIPDLYDEDTDGIFGDLTNLTVSSSAPDYVNRFTHYYLNRLKTVGKINYDDIKAFQKALKEFVYSGKDGEGLFDPPKKAPCGAGPTSEMPAECDPCCQPQFVLDGDGMPTATLMRPECCDTDSDKCGFRTNGPLDCVARSPFRSVGITPPDYGMIYDPFYENSRNNDPALPSYNGPPAFISMREAFGKDDEHPQYHVDPVNPRWHSDPIGSPQIYPLPTDNFYFEDATGVFRLPDYVTIADLDDQVGIFPFFHKIKDFGVRLTALTYADRECHWCDPNWPAAGGIACDVDTPADRRDPELALPRDPADPSKAVAWAGSACLDNANIAGSGNSPQVLDVVPGFGPNAPDIPNVLARDADCASVTGGWKKGTDSYCSDTEPYSAFCPQHRNDIGVKDAVCSQGCPPADPDPYEPNICTPGTTVPRDCTCQDAAADPAKFRNDNLDNFVYGSAAFIQFAMDVIAQKPSDIYKDFEDWYETYVDPWIKIGGDLDSLAAGLVPFRDGINQWLNSNNRVANCSNAWCVPPAAGCPCSKAGEVNVSPGIDGTIQCLTYNAYDTKKYVVENKYRTQIRPRLVPPQPALPSINDAVGNAAKFERCRDYCSYEACMNLPRSLVPTFCGLYGNDKFLKNPAGQGASFNTIYQCLYNFVATAVALPRTFELIKEQPTFFNCGTSCAALPLSMTTLLGTVNRPVFVPPNITYSCVAPRSCNAPSPFMTSVNRVITALGDCSSYPGADCQVHLASFQACYAKRHNCTGVGPTNNFNTILGFSCSVQCANLPRALNYTGGTLDYTAPPLNLQSFISDFQIQESGTAGSCVDPAYFDTVYKMLSLSNERCVNEPAYFDAVDVSAASADNQVQKMIKRIQFLDNRLPEAQDAVAVLDRAINGVNNFLNSPEVQAFRAYADDFTENVKRLRGFAIYAWQDPQRKTKREILGRAAYDGYWHIAKVEARVPKRCNKACGLPKGGAAGGKARKDKPWPHVEAYTKSWNTVRCYALRGTEGIVKVRAIRWDEEREKGRITLPNMFKIWDFTTTYPGQENPPVNLGLEGFCSDYIDPLLNQGKYQRFNWDRAFMINEPPWDCTGSCSEILCWEEVHKRLQKGVMSQACARYHFAGETEGFQVLFTQCDDEFLAGDN